jgi:class 3 adenylate cyclase
MRENARVAELRSRNLGTPDEPLSFPGLEGGVVHLGDITVGRMVIKPGWRWSKDVKPVVGGDWCQARHLGVVLSGRFGAMLEDGTTLEFGPNDVFEIPPGHDGWTIGDEPCVQIEWSGMRAFTAFQAGLRNRMLATLLFTDVVDSTVRARELGDAAWRDRLSAYLESMRRELDHHGGREVETTGDGLLATFDGPAQALRCAAGIRRGAVLHGLEIRAGVHVGEVDLVGSDVRGVAVHEAARVMASANAGEIVVSEITRTIARSSGLEFEDRGMHELKGLSGQWRLYAFVASSGQHV